MVSYTQHIALPISKVWEHFLYKVEHPSHFVPGISKVHILEKTEDYVLRQMNLTNPQGEEITLVERITHKPYEVRYAIEEHPKYKGYVLNKAESISEQLTAITYSLYWQDKHTGSWYEELDTAKNAVLKTISFMEQHKS